MFPLPRRPPLAGLFQYMVGHFAFTGRRLPCKSKAFTLIIGNMRKRPPGGSGQAANISGAPRRNRRARKGNAIARVKAQHLSTIRFHSITFSLLALSAGWLCRRIRQLYLLPARSPQADLSIMLYMDKSKWSCPGVKYLILPPACYRSKRSMNSFRWLPIKSAP
jgi:hypothetical protein